MLANANGVLRVSLALEDDGASEHSGQNRSTTDMLIRVLPVNDRPSFTISANSIEIWLNESLHAQDVLLNAFFTVFAPPVDEQNQKSSFFLFAAMHSGRRQVFGEFSAAVSMSVDGRLASLSLSLPPALYGNISLYVHMEENRTHADATPGTPDHTAGNSIYLLCWYESTNTDAETATCRCMLQTLTSLPPRSCQY